MKTISSTVLKKTALLLIPMILSATAAKSADVKGPYFGQTPPGATPRIFAPGILSLTNRFEARIAFSSDGKECFFTVTDSTFSHPKLYHTKCVDNVWTPQVEATFSAGHNKTGEPFFSADGNKLYFTCDAHVWVIQRTSQGWSDPQALPSPINPASGYSETADGVAYFISDRPGGLGRTDIWRTLPQQPGQPLQVQDLGSPVNSSSYEFDPCIAPDGQYLIFASVRAGGHGGTDLYVSFTNGNGGWNTPVNLDRYGAGFNTYADEYAPSLSQDGRFLFFIRHNGQQGDVYWATNPVPKTKTSKSADVTGP